MATEDLSQRSAQDVLRETDRNSYGVVRILADAAGTPGEEREYQAGDEAIVEAGQAEWVVAPVHLPAAGRRLDTDAEQEAAPADGVEAYPPAEPTVPGRRAQARAEGVADAHVDEGLADKLASRRREAARSSSDGDARLQAELGGRGARSGPVTAQSDLPVDQPTPADRAAADEAARANEAEQPRASRSAKNSKE
jgi:hypothetical protein